MLSFEVEIYKTVLDLICDGVGDCKDMGDEVCEGGNDNTADDAGKEAIAEYYSCRLVMSEYTQVWCVMEYTSALCKMMKIQMIAMRYILIHNSQRITFSGRESLHPWVLITVSLQMTITTLT